MIRNQIKQILYDSFGYEESVVLEEILKIINLEREKAYSDGYKEGFESQR